VALKNMADGAMRFIKKINVVQALVKNDIAW